MNFGQFLDTGLLDLYFDGQHRFDPKRPKTTARGDDRQLIVKEIEDEIDRCFARSAHATLLAGKRAERLGALIRAMRGWVGEFVAVDRSLTGIGIPTPLENGIQLDWATGWPVVPGAGIKGAVRAWAMSPDRTLDELEVACEEDFVDLFLAIFGYGPDGEVDEAAAGGIVFHDAWYLPDHRRQPEYRPPMVFDVMTPHYGEYQKGEGSKGRVAPPADWLDPNPIPFLCVREGMRLQVGIAPRTPLDDELREVAWSWLTGALSDIGVGAKTAGGFGRFRAPDAGGASGG